MTPAKRPKGLCRIGTSGWHYPHWRGAFYPKALAAKDRLAYYAGIFDTVEINNAFYRLPSEAAVQGWADGTPPGFVFACKASRYITHMKKLKDPRESLASFLQRIAGLGDKLGPVLFQLPPNWRPNPGRLEAFLEALPRKQRFAFEFRDARWDEPEVLRLLERYGAAFCCFDLGGRTSPVRVTADFAYVRLHGPGAPYRGSYSEAALADWAVRFADWQESGLDVYCYFDNDERAYAANNARGLIARLEGRQADACKVGGRSSGRR